MGLRLLRNRSLGHHSPSTTRVGIVEREAAFEQERMEDDAHHQHYLRTGEAVDHDEVAAWLDSIGTDNPLPPLHRAG